MMTKQFSIKKCSCVNKEVTSEAIKDEFTRVSKKDSKPKYNSLKVGI